MKQQILADYKELLSSEAGRRVLGGIFYNAKLNMPLYAVMNTADMGYQAGCRNLAIQIANTVREVDLLGVAQCEAAYQNLMDTYERSEDDGGGDDGWDAGGTD